MDDISYVPAVAASLVVGLVLWWAIGRYYHSRLKRSIAAVGTILLGFVVYFLFAIILAITLAVVHPERAHETGLALGDALGHGFRVLAVMLTAVTALILAV